MSNYNPPKLVKRMLECQGNHCRNCVYKHAGVLDMETGELIDACKLVHSAVYFVLRDAVEHVKEGWKEAWTT